MAVRIDFSGKGDVDSHYLTIPYYTLEADKKKSVGKVDEDGNLIIQGDNLYALKSLLPRYESKIKCIYIDPPYNTGNKDWVYNDDVVKSRYLREQQGKDIDSENPERHDIWLCMMWPRLRLLHELLAEDGVIFISIDDNEQHHLRMIMDEIFGEDNFVTKLVWVNNIKGRQITKSGAVGTYEDILVYAKDIMNMTAWNPILVSTATRLMPDAYKMQDREILNDDIGSYVIKNQLHNTNKEFNENTRPNLVFVIHYNPKTSEIRFSEVDSDVKFPGFKRIFPHKISYGKNKFHAWRWSQQKILSETKDLHFEKHGNSYRIYTKIRNFDHTNFKNLITNITNGSQFLKDINLEFPNPKPAALIKLLIQTATTKNAIILDSFAGSGTTAQAVLELNKEDGGDRKFILVECEKDIADKITAERVRRVIKGVPQAKSETLKAGLGGNFTFYTLGQEIDPEKILTGESMPDYETLAAHVFWLATGQTLPSKATQRKDWFIGETATMRLYLIYQPDIEFLGSKEAALTFEMGEAMKKSLKGTKQKAYVFAPAAYISHKDLHKLRLSFCQMPWSLRKRIMESL